MLAVVAAWMAAAAVRRYRSPARAPRVGLALRTPLRADAALAGVTVLNPLTVVYWAALVLGRQASAAAFAPARGPRADDRARAQVPAAGAASVRAALPY